MRTTGAHSLPFTAVLAIVDDGGIRSSHPFRHPRMLIGRTPDNDIALNDPNVSTRHCELATESGWLIVRDLGSINGTFVNERRISEARLADGDVVRVGKTELTIRLQMRERLRGLMGGNRKWALLGALLLGLLVFAGIAWRRSAAAHEAEVSRRFEALVKAQVQRDVCGRATAAFESLREADGEIGGRSVAIELVGGRVRQSRDGRDNNIALLALWRRKQKLYADAAAGVSARQQVERDALEKVTRNGARLASSKDKKIAFWIDGLLAQRLAATDQLLQGLRDVEKRTDKFADLVERFAVRGDAAVARELAGFQLGADAEDLLRRCEAEQARLASGVLGALNGLEED
jgi:predicted negative regulator of RcsB-dependent stress response